MAYRVQFELTDEEYNQALPYILEKKMLGHYGKISFLEYVRRRQVRTNRSLSADREAIREIVREELNK